MGERHYLSTTRNAARVLGMQLAAVRRRARRTTTDVAERAGITRQTLRRIERGDPNVKIGLIFEVATVLGVPLFGVQADQLPGLVAAGERDLALLPARIDVSAPQVDSDFESVAPLRVDVASGRH